MNEDLDLQYYYLSIIKDLNCNLIIKKKNMTLYATMWQNRENTWTLTRNLLRTLQILQKIYKKQLQHKKDVVANYFEIHGIYNFNITPSSIPTVNWVYTLQYKRAIVDSNTQRRYILINIEA